MGARGLLYGAVRRRPKEPDHKPEGEDTRSPVHDDWLLDEALRETFPASDPISPACSGESA